MSLTVNTNTLALTAQNNLNNSQKSLNSAIERLSSGSKINSAKDNAAGEAIANRLNSQISGLKQASSNANDGISLAQTTEGALDQINNNLQRVRTLTVQAANGTNSSSDLKSIQDEINQRLAEIDRVSGQTAFNGTKVLDGSKNKIDIQVGSQDGQTISIKLQNVDSNSLGLEDFSVSGADITASDVGSAAGTKARVGDSVTLNSSGFTAPGTGDGSFGDFSVDSSGNYYVKYSGDTTGSVNGEYKVTVADDGSATLGAIDSSVSASDLTAVSSVKKNVTLDKSGLGANQELDVYNGSEANAPDFVIKDTSGSATEYYAAKIDTDGTVTQGDELTAGDGTDLKTANPLAALDDALNTVDSLRSGLGAVQNRFDSAINNIDSTTVNLSSARSRITDADYATEVSNLSKAKILQQAGQSVLAQANQTSQGVITLLRSA